MRLAGVPTPRLLFVHILPNVVAPILVSATLGVGGAILIPIIDRRRGAQYYVAALILGAILPTLVAWFLVAPLRHQPIASGWNPKRMMIGPIANAMWGVGTAWLYRVFERMR